MHLLSFSVLPSAPMRLLQQLDGLLGGFLGEALLPVREDDGKLFAVIRCKEAGIIIEDDRISLLRMLLDVVADFFAA